MADCPKCEETLDYDDESRTVFRCDGCESFFQVDEDADLDGEDWRDCSTAGEEIL